MPLQRALHRLLGVHLLVWGLIYVAGPDQWASSRSFDVVRSIGLPVRAWAVLFLVAGLAVLAGWIGRGLFLAAVVSTFWGVCLVIAAFTADLTGGGGVAHSLGFAALHLLCLRFRALEQGRAGG